MFLRQLPDLGGGRFELGFVRRRFTDWLQGSNKKGPPANGAKQPYSLSELHLVDVALCGRAKDGNGTYQPQAIIALTSLLSSSDCLLHDLDITGSGMQEEEMHALGRGLHKNCMLRVLKTDMMVLDPWILLRGDTLDVEGQAFTEFDAMLMVQLLLPNTTLTSASMKV